MDGRHTAAAAGFFPENELRLLPLPDWGAPCPAVPAEALDLMGMIAMKPTVLAAACMLSAFTPALAQDLSPDAKRLLAYGTVAVVVKSCGLPITDGENKQMMDAMAK